MGFAREKYIGLFCLGRGVKYLDFRGRSPRYGSGRWFIQTRNRRSSENGHNGFAWLQSVFSDDLGNEWKSSVGFAREKYIGLFCLGRWAKYLDFCGRSPCYGCGRCFIQTHNKGRLKTRIASFSKTTISFSDDLLCIWIFNQTAKSAATQSQSRPATCFAAAVL